MAYFRAFFRRHYPCFGNRLAQLDFTFRPIPPGSTVSLCVKMLHFIFFLKIGKNDVTRHGQTHPDILAGKCDQGRRIKYPIG